MRSIIKAATVALGVLLITTACSGAQITGESQPGKVVAKDTQLQLLQAGRAQTLYQSATEIEALAAIGPWVVWTEDNRNNLMLANAGRPDQFQAVEIMAQDHDVDLICMAPLGAEMIDVFVHDGDQYFYHYWLSVKEASLRLARRMATNPDIDACEVTATQLVFNDPYLGLLAIDRDPETDAIISRAEHGLQEHSFDVLSVSLNDLGQSPNIEWTELVATIETSPVADDGDAADDPVVLPAGDSTWVVGTNKKRGLAAYNLSGLEQAFIARGRLNNVDAVRLDDDQYLLAASNRTTKSIDLFIAKPTTQQLEFFAEVPVTMEDPYGLCMAQIDGSVAVFMGDSEGLFEHWQLSADYTTGERVSRYHFDSQTEGCVFDSDSQTVFVGQEDTGIFAINPATQARELVQPVDHLNLFDDVEGLDIYHRGDQSYLIASSQGDDSFVMYQMQPWTQVAKFRIVADLDTGIDGASETDGLAVSNQPLPGFPEGVLVVQDGRNRAPMDAQNFKIVDWRLVQEVIH